MLGSLHADFSFFLKFIFNSSTTAQKSMHRQN